jgi:predicted transcriptional regulator
MVQAPKEAKLLVKEVFHSAPSFSLIVEESTPIREIIKNFAEKEELRGIFVARDGKLSGVITRKDLLIWTRIKFGLKGSADFFQWRGVFEVAQATAAMDICCKDGEQSFVHPETSIENALMVMQNNDLIDIPVVDKEMRILGDLHLSDILAKALEIDVSTRGSTGR